MNDLILKFWWQHHHQNSWYNRFLWSKSFYISCLARYSYEAKFEIWAGLGWLGCLEFMNFLYFYNLFEQHLVWIKGHSIITWTRWGGGGQKMSVFVHTQDVKTVHSWEEAVNGKILSTLLLNDPYLSRIGIYDVVWNLNFLGLQCYADPNLSVVYFTNRDRSPHDLHRMTLPMILRIASRCSLLNLAKFSFNPFVHLFRLFDFFWSDWQRINWIKSSKFSNLLERFKYSSSLSPFFQVHTIQIICMKIKSEIPQPNWHYTV